MFFVVMMFVLFPIFFITAILLIIGKATQSQKNEEETFDEIKGDNIYTPKEQFDFKKNLELDHLDGPFPEDEFETSDSIEYKEFDLSPVKKKKKISLTRREALLFAIVDEPKCKKGRTR